MPLQLVNELIKWLPPLAADEQDRAILAASVPHYRPADQRRILWRLRSEASALYPDEAPEPAVEHIEENPEKAAEWFRSRGVRVVRSA